MLLPPPEWHETLDSTNSYLLRKFESEAHLFDGFAVVAQHQMQGRGQRNKKWIASHGKSLLFSIGARPAAGLHQQALFSFGIAVTVAETLEAAFALQHLTLKWPNDLYIADSKLGGILVENTLRGSQWHLAVVGIGLNLWPQPVGEDFKAPPAFLADHTAVAIDARHLAIQLQQALAAFMTQPLPADIERRYNDRLYRRGEVQTFETDGVRWQGRIVSALPDGRLLAAQAGQERLCVHGHDLWIPAAGTP